MSKKPAKITTADVERVLANAGKARDDMNDLIVTMHAGLCEHLDDPMLCARRCMGISNAFGQAASHFLCRAELQERDASRRAHVTAP